MLLLLMLLLGAVALAVAVAFAFAVAAAVTDTIRMGGITKAMKLLGTASKYLLETKGVFTRLAQTGCKYVRLFGHMRLKGGESSRRMKLL